MSDSFTHIHSGSLSHSTDVSACIFFLNRKGPMEGSPFIDDYIATSEQVCLVINTRLVPRPLHRFDQGLDR